ncbi:MAG: hypothetical protein ACRDZX_10930 [Acidimicrobiales bacterium]
MALDRARRWSTTPWSRGAGVLAVVASVMAAGAAGPAPAGAQPAPAGTRSYYEHDATATTLARQGERAGRSAAKGIVILDFGRPAYDAGVYGTMGYNGLFVPTEAVRAGVEAYIAGYFRNAPSYTTLDVAVGTNNSCGPGQPCGNVASCGCPDEPPDLVAWGGQLAVTVEEVRAWVSGFRAREGYTDDVRVVAADDAEPAYDPEFHNTYAVLAGYAKAVGSAQPAMVDYGSAEANFWSEDQLLQVAYGFSPDVPMPEIYYPAQVHQWASLVAWAKLRRHKRVSIFGVLTGGTGTVRAGTAYAEMLAAVGRLTDQKTIPWLSTIRPYTGEGEVPGIGRGDDQGGG